MGKSLSKSRFIELFGNPTINEKGFPLLTVDDVIKFEGGSQPNKAFFEYEKTENNIRLIQIRDYKTDEYITYIPKDMAKRLCSADDIMIGRYGPPIFQILQGIEGAYNVALMKAIPKKGNKDFIRSWLKQDCLLKYLEALSGRTAGQDGIQMDKLKAYPFPYPPIELQDQWVKIDKQIDKSKFILQKMIEKLELLKKSRFIEMFGDPNSNAKGYDKKPLRDLFALQMGKTPPRKEMKYWTDATNKWISISDMSTYDKYTTDTKEKIADCAISDTGIKVVPKNTVIMSFKLSIGKTAITSEDIYTNEAIMAFVKKNEKINNSFLSYALKMVDWTSTSSNAVKGVTLNKEIIGNKDFFIPPIELQNEFEKFSNQVDKSKLILQKQLEDLVGETK